MNPTEMFIFELDRIYCDLTDRGFLPKKAEDYAIELAYESVKQWIFNNRAQGDLFQ